MLKRIKLIQGVGTFSQSRASGIELTKVTVIYAENRNGKSTFCDVIQSLAEDSSEYVMNRQSIPNLLHRPAKIELQFDTIGGNVVSVFENGQWQPKTPSCSKLYVFDQSFIHRNVFTGQRLERPNSENMTSFILGESNTALFENLAEMNVNLREERRLLSTIEGQFAPHGLGNIQGYTNSVLPVETKAQLEEQIVADINSKQQITTTIQNIDKIKQRASLGAVGTQVDFSTTCSPINTLLASSLGNVHQGSLVILQEHMTKHVNDSAAFKGWANQGIAQIKDDCPFCGQVLGADAENLIAAYQQAFNAEFDRFNSQTRQALNGLRQPFKIPSTRESLNQQHQGNKQRIELYSEPQIADHLESTPLIALLDQKFAVILASYDVVSLSCQQTTELWNPILEKKFATPYEQIEQINFDDLLRNTIVYNQSIYEYWLIVEQINTIFDTFKSSLSEAQLNTELTNISEQHERIKNALKRIELEPLCIQYKYKLETITIREAAYQTRKLQLEQSQTSYLDSYFQAINELFRQLGSSDFEIVKFPNNRGMQVIYDLRIKFKGEEVSADKINSVFCESDRRALALSIFLAKLTSLSTEEKTKAILVLDDPVTSFDNERISLILNKLHELNNEVKQLIITTHYKSMAASVTRKFRSCAKALKICKGANTSEIVEITLHEMMATDHDLAFDKIMAFNNREIQGDILRLLRPFFEEEIRRRFKKQLLQLGLSLTDDLSNCITKLGQNNYIEPSIEVRLNAIRDTLNTPMHNLEEGSIENTRALSEEIMQIIYHDLKCSRFLN